MTLTPPFERTDLPHQTRILGGAIADVYATIADVTAWPRWVPGLVDPVIIKGRDSFFYRTRAGDQVQHHEGAVIVRGPTHTFGVQLHEGRLWFRTRPNPLGTKVDIVLEPPTAGRLGRLFGTHRRHTRRQSWLDSILDGLVDQL